MVFWYPPSSLYPSPALSPIPRSYYDRLSRINALEPTVSALSDTQLRKKTGNNALESAIVKQGRAGLVRKGPFGVELLSLPALCPNPAEVLFPDLRLKHPISSF